MHSSPYPPGPPETARMPGPLVFVLVTVTVHALGTAFGGWAILQENLSKQEHGQDLLTPMGMAWFVALFCWGWQRSRSSASYWLESAAPGSVWCSPCG
ncbi:hypothetical protein [Streptomyces sp. Wb2n-11]|uniref:hypothetical protein n=1 Tax=Streptomyces sp. Wb2n-11 TaxID=1030533 RepID=UPI000AD04B48|nr:hypothetical protein [Streptomyces sp. Wb2n-11]